MRLARGWGHVIRLDVETIRDICFSMPQSRFALAVQLKGCIALPPGLGAIGDAGRLHDMARARTSGRARLGVREQVFECIREAASDVFDHMACLLVTDQGRHPKLLYWKGRQ